MAIRRPLNWFVEAFSVLTASAFVVSAAFNGFAFWSVWRLNYFMIAGPADVVMSGFLLFASMATLVVTIYLVTLVPFGAYWRLRSAVAGSAREKRRSMARVKALLRRFKMLFGLRDRESLHFLILLPVGGFLVLGALLNLRVVEPIFYESGLTVAADAEIAQKCQGARVLWLGSSAAILECQDGVRVLHKLDDLETVRRFP